MKDFKELVKLKDDALDGRLSEISRELMKVRSQVASGTVPKNPGRIKVIKKTVARILTIKSERKKQRNE